MKDASRIIALNLCGHGFVIISVLCVVHFIPMGPTTTLSLVIAACSFSLVFALKSIVRAVVLTGFRTDMNIRYLSVFLHDLRKNGLKPADK